MQARDRPHAFAHHGAALARQAAVADEGAELVAQLRLVCEGDTVVDQGLAGRVALSAAHLSRGEFWSGVHLGLTQRESEVLELLVAGHSNKAVASKLVVSEDTVKTQARRLFRKLGARDRAQAVALGFRRGFVA